LASIHYGVPYWLDRLPVSRRPQYPRHRGRVDVDVAIAGGGMTGCVIAEVFATAGVRVALFEAARLGQGSTAAQDGIVLHEPGPEVRAVLAEQGLRRARAIVRATRRASLDFVAAIRRLHLVCGLEAADAIAFVPASDEGLPVRREYAARREAGLDDALVPPSRLQAEAGLAGVGLRSRGHSVLDPYRACLGFARAGAERGALVFERSPVLRARHAGRRVEIETDAGTAGASAIIIATGYPGGQYKPLQRHFTRSHRYAVLTTPLPATVRHSFGAQALLLRELSSPGHRLRWLQGDRVLFSGADQSVVSDRARRKAIVQRTGQLMYELSVLYPAVSGILPAYGWDGVNARTADNLPYVGPHRNYPKHLFAFPSEAGGPGSSYLAARILLRHFHATAAQDDELFSFSRMNT
jgi:glycine/D-amino acid oxidase-like deaminating enzyme